MRLCNRPLSGFTLAETLVALLILSLVSAAGTALLIGATGAGQQLRAAEAEARKLDIAQALIRQDIAALSPRAVIPDTGFGDPGNLFGGPPSGNEPFLSFVRDGWLNPVGLADRSDLQRVQYRLDQGQVIRDAIVRPDATRATPVSSRVLFDQVAEIELAFWRGGTRSDYWDGDAGQPLHILPDLIELELRFENGEYLRLAAVSGGRG